VSKRHTTTGQPLVSVVIPSYNHDKWIATALESALNQTYNNLEILIVDNHSTDLTDKVLSHFSDSRLQILKVNNLGSIAYSRNKALMHAKGEWVAFLDSDDWWASEKIMEVSKHFDEDTDLIYHHMTIHSEIYARTRSDSIRSRSLKNPVFLDLLINGNTIATSSVVVRKTLLLSVKGMREDSELIGTEDFNTWLRIAKKTNKFVLVPKYLGFYRQHTENISTLSGNEATSEATKEFLGDLTLSQMNSMQAVKTYQNVRKRFLEKSYIGLESDLIRVLRFGRKRLKIRSLYMLLIVSFTNFIKT
jgi:glycosyltransferase involved in cell wall biosynthesis